MCPSVGRGSFCCLIYDVFLHPAPISWEHFLTLTLTLYRTLLPLAILKTAKSKGSGGKHLALELWSPADDEIVPPLTSRSGLRVGKIGQELGTWGPMGKWYLPPFEEFTSRALSLLCEHARLVFLNSVFRTKIPRIHESQLLAYACMCPIVKQGVRSGSLKASSLITAKARASHPISCSPAHEKRKAASLADRRSWKLE